MKDELTEAAREFVDECENFNGIRLATPDLMADFARQHAANEVRPLRNALEFYAEERLWEADEDNGEHGLYRYSFCGTKPPWTVARKADNPLFTHRKTKTMRFPKTERLSNV